MSATTPASPANSEDEMDPLDAYMASLATEVTEQARGDSISPPPPGSTLRQQRPPPSQAIRAIVDKVSASSYCDVLAARTDAKGRRRAGVEGRRDLAAGSLGDAAADPLDTSFSHQGGDSPAAAAAAAAAAACLTLLVDQPAEFLSRFGHILSPGDLDSLLPSQDPVVALHVTRLKSLMLSQERRQQERQQDQALPAFSTTDEDVDMPPATPPPPPTAAAAAAAAAAPAGAAATGTAGAFGVGDEGTGGRGGGDGVRGRQSSATVRNRRYRRLQQLEEGGVWFSDEAMRERDPWLWFEYVGKGAGEEKPAPKQAVQEVPGSTSVGTYLQESLGFLSQQQSSGGWPTDGIPSSTAAAGAGGPRRGAGSALGMAFLSGVCADAGGAQDVQAGEDVDCSDVPSAAAATTLGGPNFSGGVRARRDRRRQEDDEDGDDMGAGDAAEVTAAVAAIGIRDGGGGGGGGGGDMSGEDEDESASDGGREGEANVERRRVRFAEEEGESEDDDVMQEGGGGDGGEEEEEEEETEGGRDEVARILSERFLSGLEEGVDYRTVDDDERLDDLDQISRDEQDRWFHGEEEDSSMDLK